MMRLPVKNGDQTDFDYEQLFKMVDTFMEAGFTYFDTSYVYHNGKSEEVTRKALVERHPRNSFTVPASVEKALKEMDPDASVVSWALRFAGSMDGVLCNLSGMSTLEQVKENIRSVRKLEPLTDSEREKLGEIVKIYKDAGPFGADLSRYEGLKLHGATVTGILEAYNMCQLQPDPGYSDDNNYLKNVIAEQAHLDCFGELPDEKVIPQVGTILAVTNILSCVIQKIFHPVVGLFGLLYVIGGLAVSVTVPLSNSLLCILYQKEFSD